MSRWKQLSENLKESKIMSISTLQKYTPKKLTRDENSPLRFLNKSREKQQSSFVSEQKNKSIWKNQSRDESFFCQPRVPRVLKASSSDIRLKLRDQDKNPNENSRISQDSPLLKPVQFNNNDKMRKSFMGKSQKTYLFQQIRKIKKQFCVFQSIILKQLQKQQKLINQTLQQIIKQVIQQKNTQTKRFERSFLQSLNSPKEGDFIEKYLLDKFLPDTANNPKKFRRIDTFKLDSQFETSQFTQNQQKLHNKSFQKIFKAVKNLKKDIIQLNMIGDISAITSPKGQIKNCSWDDSIFKQR